MSAALIGVAGIFVLALGLALYFLFGQKNCTKITQEGKCKAPCKWDLYGNKCIDKNTTPTTAPASVPDDVAEATATTQNESPESQAARTQPETVAFKLGGYTEFAEFSADKGSTCKNDPNECGVACNYEEDCIGFTQKNDKCCLLQKVSGMQYDNESAVHIKTPEGYSIKELGDRQGGVLETHSDKTLAQCASACKSANGCVGISYRSGECELKEISGLSEVYSDTGKQFMENNNPRPACERDMVVTGLSGTLGACESVNDVDPREVTFQGAWFSPKNPTRGAEWIYKVENESDPNKNVYIVSHQSTDNWCKMIKFEVKKNGENCDYEAKTNGYVTSPADASTCTTGAEVISHWNNKNDTPGLATSNDEGGYGIQKLKYNKYC